MSKMLLKAGSRYPNSFKGRITAALCFTLLIYLSLPFTPHLVNSIRSAGMLRFTIGLFFTVASIFLMRAGFRYRCWRRLGFWLFLPLLLVSLYMMEPLISSPVDRLHILLYGMLAVAYFLAFRRFTSGYKVYIFTLIAISLAGVVDEVIQYFIPSRVFDFNDILFNLAGGIISLAAIRYIYGVKD